MRIRQVTEIYFNPNTEQQQIRKFEHDNTPSEWVKKETTTMTMFRHEEDFFTVETEEKISVYLDKTIRAFS